MSVTRNNNSAWNSDVFIEGFSHQERLVSIFRWGSGRLGASQIRNSFTCLSHVDLPPWHIFECMKLMHASFVSCLLCLVCVSVLIKHKRPSFNLNILCLKQIFWCVWVFRYRSHNWYISDYGCHLEGYTKLGLTSWGSRYDRWQYCAFGKVSYKCELL